MPNSAMQKGFITILTGLYSFQDCIHFLAAVRRFHREPIIVLIDRVPRYLHPLLYAFGNVILKPAPANANPVLASRLAKLALYEASPFEQTIYLDSDICLLTDINDVFEDLRTIDFLLTQDVQPDITQATNLLRVPQDVLSTLQAVGLPLTPASIQYNGGFMAFRKSPTNAQFFQDFQQHFATVCQHQDVLLLKDQGAFAAAMMTAQPSVKVLPPTYNYLSKWKDSYDLEDPIKVLHCTYPYRPQYAKNITRSWYTRIFDRVAHRFLPNQVNNPWRSSKAN
jgi:lipopolysaccharide biosynthesis glycosyltransferase